MNLKYVFYLKLLLDDIYQLWNENIIRKSMIDRWKNLDFSKFDIKINQLLNSITN